MLKIGLAHRFSRTAGTAAALLAMAAGLGVFSLAAEDSTLQVTGVRSWTFEGITRVAIETTGECTFESDRLQNPDRIFFDVIGAVPHLEGQTRKGAKTIQVGDPILKQIRVARTRPDVTRVVLDLKGPADCVSSELANPSRLIIELRPAGSEAQPGTPSLPRPPSATPTADRSAPVVSKSTPAAVRDQGVRRFDPQRSLTSSRQLAVTLESPPRLPEREPASLERPLALRAFLDPPSLAGIRPPVTRTAQNPGKLIPRYSEPRSARSEPPKISIERRAPVEEHKAPTETITSAEEPAPAPPRKNVAGPVAEGKATVDKPARPASNGNRSLTRAMGLKVGRIVIDAGHGGHDTGTISRSGLYEKDITLDIAKRLGKLVEDGLGYEVVYSRTDDTFVPLTERTRIANEKQADLFVSIHLNSSPSTQISGSEVFFLNLHGSPYAMDVAARENASGQQSVHELRDLIQKIALTEKIEESKEFAVQMQGSMQGELARLVRSPKDRGVKKAPFVVLIGAAMPSILVEVGFLSNTREEGLLKRSDHRQRVAKALYDGITRYSSSLSQTRLASKAAF